FRPALADGRVLHLGQPVALVVADSYSIAQDAADAVEVIYEPLPAVVGVQKSIEKGAPQIWSEAPSNVALNWPGVVQDDDNEAEVQRIFATAARLVHLTSTNQRLVVASMEPRGASANYDRRTGIFTLRCGSQGASVLRDEIAA